ncbi:MAG: TonB-dependent receptor [Acidobacteriota bacterium]|nr:MAG: TonB-dependent receptor [Acidobacteriota bacterium]
MISFRTLRHMTAVVVTLMACAAVALGQASLVSGTVVDPQGNAVVNATVTLTNAATGAARTATTSNDGTYQIPQVVPGTYTARIEAQGFATVVQENVVVLVSTPLTLNMAFKQIGQVSETVTVQGGETTINTTDATIGNNFVAQQITQLPLNARNVVGLLSLQPGVTPDGSVTGSRSDQANVTLDGVDVNEQQGASAFESVLRVTPDSVQEFRVTTTNPNAAQGRSSGAQVALITKGGSNEFHGLLYEYHRNTVTTANDWFNNRTVDPDTGRSIPRPKLIRNIYGGSVSGPIIKDKAFFFYTHEGRRDASQTSVLRPIPLPSLGLGQLKFPETQPDGSTQIVTLSTAQLNALYPGVGMNPAAIAVFADAASRYPANDPGEGDGLNYGGYRFNAPTPLRWNTNIAKLDFNLSEKHTLSVRGNYQWDIIGGVPYLPDSPRPNTWYHPTGVALNHTWIMTNNLVNNLRYGLTRLAQSIQGDSGENGVTFRFIYQPAFFSRTLNRITPVHNITDDVSYTRGSHNLQFGTNIRIIRNQRTSFSNSYDFATANPSFYAASGAVLSNPIVQNYNVGGSFISPIRTVMSALIGRFSQYSGNFNFGADGNVLPVGEGVARNFNTEEYDWYVQDTWRVTPSLTLTFGLRYGLSRPVYEANGLQVKPTVSLGEYFDKRVAASAQGVPFNELLTVDLAGPANNKPGFYDWDKNNFQPRVAVAWSPNFQNDTLRKIFGDAGKSVFRGGFALVNDYFGQQLAVQFDLNNTLGFSSSQTIAANTYNVTTNPAPLFTGFGQSIRTLPGITVPASLQFPLTTPADEAQRIESSLDDTLISPTNYSWNVSFSREMPMGMTVEASYVGRLGRNLLATRDIMALNNLVDTKSGTDWYTAATQLANLRLADTPVASVQPIPYFENLFPGIGGSYSGIGGLSATQEIYYLVDRNEGYNILDWTYIQLLIDDLGTTPNLFFHPQYAAFSTFSTIASSDYHAGTLTVKQRLRNQLFLDFNYTFSKSLDDTSGLQTSGAYGGAFILNPLRPKDNRAVSDFDSRHIINANAVWDLPIGRGRSFGSGMSRFVDAVVGGWQLSSIFRWNTGFPAVSCCFDKAQWATNWNVQSNGTRIKPLEGVENKRLANIFADPTAAYQSFRNALPGETGERNFIRLPGYIGLDLGLAKTWTMPWSEAHRLQFRWDSFNITNTQRLGSLLATRDGLGLDIDPQTSAPPAVFGNFNGIQGTPRIMQFALRYEF